MKIKGILKYSISMLYRKRGFLAIEIIMLTLSMCLLNHAFIQYNIVNQNVIALKRNIDMDVDELYKVDFSNVTILSESSGKEVFQFTKELGDLEGIKMSGAYYVEGLGILEQDTDTPKEISSIDMVFIDSSILGINSIKNTSNNNITLDEEEYVDLAVGCNLEDIMPVGSKWIDTYYGREYIVKDVIKKSETWMTTNIIMDGEYELCLDNMVVTLFDDNSFAHDGYMTSFIFANNVFFTLDEENAEKIKDDVTKLGTELGCPVSIKSVGDVIEDHKDSYKEYYTESNFQVAMMVAMTMIGMLMTMIISLNNQKNNIKVMHIFGVGLREHRQIHMIGEAVMFIIAYALSYPITFRLTIGWYKENLDYINNIIPYSMCFLLIMYIVIEFAAGRVIRSFLDKSVRIGE